MLSDLPPLDPDRPVLLAGPTASGKSALALAIAEAQGRAVVNADALQVYANWRVLSARPDAQDCARAPHLLYGHVGADQPYSAGHWLREVAAHIAARPAPVIVGGTGLYFTALTAGLAQIPDIPSEIRAEGNARMQAEGRAALLAELDAATAARIDSLNPARVQRAWEVLRATGRGLAHWQDDTPPPILPPDACHRFVIDAPKPWLTPRIEARFDQMLQAGALDEARQNLARWDPARPASRAIGAPELIAHLRGEIDLPEASRRATIATVQYAKRQRTWFKARMGDWTALQPR